MPPIVVLLLGLVLGGVGEWLVPLGAGLGLAGAGQLTAAGALIALGLMILVWAIRAFVRAGTNVPTWMPSTALVTEGPYRLSRNPIYLALALIYAGLALAFSAWWALVLLPLVGLVLHFGIVRREEVYLERKFGDDYRRYLARTRRYL